MKKEVKNAITTCLMIILTSSVFSKPKQQPTTPVKEPKIIEVAYTTTNEPYTFINEKGTPDGFELAVLKAVDELIPEYKFKFRGTNDEEVLIGTEKGKYQIAINGLCLTDELKTNFLIPQSPISSNIIGIVIRKENSNEIHDFKSFARYSGNLAPISSQSVLYSVIQNYNEKQYDNQIKLISSDIFKISDSYLQIIEGHYDALLTQKYSFKK
jgi:L-cystine transport system substrate-binding protein